MAYLKLLVEGKHGICVLQFMYQNLFPGETRDNNVLMEKLFRLRGQRSSNYIELACRI